MSQSGRDKIRSNRGSALILVLTIVSFIAILGAIAMSTALMNIKTRGLNRASDKNFYRLETALDEIYAQTGRLSSEILKAQYADILSSLYQKDEETALEQEDRLDTNAKANVRLKTAFTTALMKEFELELSEDPRVEEENCRNAAEKLKGLATSFVKEATEAETDNFTVTVESVTFLTSSETAEDAAEPENGHGDIYSGISINGLCITYVNPETEIESALTVDMKIETPYVRFINNGSAMLDYILIANGGIEIGAGADAPGETKLNGNIYGTIITIDHAKVEADSALIAAAGNLTVKQNGTLVLGPGEAGDREEAEKQSRVWVDGIELNAGSSLKSENTSFFVRDDLTLLNNGNKAELSGRYYGYGNEGYSEDKVVKETKDKSSAILLNDKKGIVDLRGLDSLMLAGRAYLRFNSDAGYSQYVYPMGESIAVKATQSMYLIPEEYISVKIEDEETKGVGSNPFLFPDGKESVELTVTLPADRPVKKAEASTKTYHITKEDLEGAGAGRIGSDDDTTAFLVSLDKKIYVYYNFENEEQRSSYFEQYLTDHAEAFEVLLKKGGVTGGEDGSGIYISDEGKETTKNLFTSGALYQVTGNGGEEDAPLFELLSVGRDGVSSSLTWVEFEERLTQSFKNLKENLSEVKRVNGRRETKAAGGESLLPVGNYVRISKLEKPVLYPKRDGANVILVGGSAKLVLSGNSAAVTLVGNGTSATGDMEAGHGLIVASGNVKISGSGTFSGLIMAGGKITIDGASDIELIADPSIYQDALEDEKIAGYFYDYSDAASAVLNQYENFVTKENWSRTGLERSDEKNE